MQKKGMFLLSTLVYGSVVHAATPVDLGHLNTSYLQPYLSASAAPGATQLQKGRQSVDFKKTHHVRYQQLYKGHPVLGGEAIVHIPNGVALNAVNSQTMDGKFYQNLDADLGNAPAAEQAQKAVQAAITTLEQKAGGKVAITEQNSKLVVFIDKSDKAHWAYQVNFTMPPAKTGEMPSKPVYIMDAVSFQVYAQWNNIKTIEKTDEVGGGFGGNEKMGKLDYDGGAGNLANYHVRRDAATSTCYMKNNDVTVMTYGTSKVETFICDSQNAEHNNVFWAGETDAVNGGYSPADDALFGGMVIKNMYQDWYGVPVLTNSDGTPMMLTMVVHAQMDNAYWDGIQMTFGDGITMFYPLTSLGVAAHEISHGFTEQHADLQYYDMSGGMNESFSDMAAQAAEFYAYGKNSWQIGPEIFKREGEALRYMDKPSKDCHGKNPGNWCSIDNAKQYFGGLDPHYSSGVYNRFFYLLSTSKGWTVKQAFDVMVQANSSYWTSNSTYEEAACGVLKAAKDLNFDNKAILKAFKKVSVKTSKC